MLVVWSGMAQQMMPDDRTRLELLIDLANGCIEAPGIGPPNQESVCVVAIDTRAFAAALTICGIIQRRWARTDDRDGPPLDPNTKRAEDHALANAIVLLNMPAMDRRDYAAAIALIRNACRPEGKP